MMRKLVVSAFACVAFLFFYCANPSSSEEDDDTIAIADMYEPDNIQSMAKQIDPDVSSQARTLKKDDIDWVYFSALTGKSYTIFTTGKSDTRIKVYSSLSTTPVLEGDDSPGDINASVVLNCTSSGTYYICVSSSDITASGSYNLSVTSSVGLDSFEPDSTPKLSHLISTSQQSRSLTLGDVDWVSCNITANDTVLMTATGNCRMLMALYDRDSTTMLTSTPAADSISQIKYRVVSSGTYFLKISAQNPGAKGSYRLTMQTSSSGTLVTTDIYESDNTRGTAKLLMGVSTLQQRSLTVGDTDWVKLPVTIGRQYSLILSNSSYTEATMYAKDGTVLQGPSSALLLNCSATDTVYIRINPVTSTTANYTLSLSVLLQPTVPDEYEVDNTKAQAKLKIVASDTFFQDRTLTFTNSVPDTDWVAFQVMAGKQYTFKATSTSSSVFYMYLYNSQSSSYINYTNSSTPFTYTPTISDTMYLMIRLSGTTAMAYSLSVQGKFSNDSYEPDSSRSTAKAITSVAQNRILLPNDTDWVMYTSTPGDSFVILTTGITDTKLSLFSSSGSTPISENDDITSSNTNGMISWKSTLGGQFYIRVIGKTPAVNGPYVLQMQSVLSGTLVAADTFEVDNSKAKARLILDSLLTAEAHSLTMDDTDWVAIPVLAGGQYTVSANSTSYLNMNLYSSRDSLLITRTSYTNPSIVYVAPKNDTLYYSVTATSAVQRYTLSMSRIAPPNPDQYESDNTKAKARIILDSVLTGEVHSLNIDDTDWVAFPVLAGGQYTISGSSLSYLTLYGYTSSGLSIGSRVSTTAPLIAYTAPTNDTLYFRVTATSPVQRYTLSMNRIAPPSPDQYENDNTRAKARIILDTVLTAEAHSLNINDTDWVAFPVIAGGQYTVSASSTISLSMNLYSSRDSLLITRTSYTNPSIAYTASKNDTLYYRITSSSIIQRYTISMAQIVPPRPDIYEDDNSRSLAKSIKLDSLQSHTITQSDTDWVKIEVTANSTYQVTTTASMSHYVYTYLGSSTSYSVYGNTKSNSLLVTPTVDDTLFIMVRQYSSSLSYLVPYTIVVTEKSTTPSAGK